MAQTNFTAQFAINGQRGVEATFANGRRQTSATRKWEAPLSPTSTWTPSRALIQAPAGCPLKSVAAPPASQHPHPLGASGFHGSVFEFVRNSAFDARNYFDYATPAIRPHPALSPQMSSDSPTAARSFCPHLRRAGSAPSYFFPGPGFPPGASEPPR